jgi:uncharacterized protein
VYKKTVCYLQIRKRVILLVVQLAALLHDIADSKFHDGDETWDPKTARFFLDSEVSEEISGHVVKIIENISLLRAEISKDLPLAELDVARCRPF